VDILAKTALFLSKAKRIMSYKAPVLSQERMVRLWATREMYLAETAAVLRLLRNGSEIELGPMTLNYAALGNPVAAPLVVSSEEQPASLSAGRLPLLRTLLSGDDLARLNRAGLLATARLQRRANARLCSEVLAEVKAERARIVESIKTRIAQRGEWGRACPILRSDFEAGMCLLRSRLAILLYRRGLPGAQRMGLRAAETLQTIFDSWSESLASPNQTS
jgi:hypothetical protein